MNKRIVEMEMQHILTIAAHLFVTQTMGKRAADPQLETYYPNIMTAIPNAFVQWEKEYREYEAQWETPEYEMGEHIERMRAEMQIAFQFPTNYVR